MQLWDIPTAIYISIQQLSCAMLILFVNPTIYSPLIILVGIMVEFLCCSDAF